MARIEKQIEVDVPVRTAYNQWTQFEEFPEFMEGIQEVRQLDETRLHWTAAIAGRQKEWEARITEQVPDERVAWVSESGAQNDGIVEFRPIGPDRTLVSVAMDFEPEGLVENVGNALGLASGRIEGDLGRFKEFIETRGVESGAWRGQIHDGEARPAGSASTTTSQGTLGSSETSMGYGGESGMAGQGGGDFGSSGTRESSMTQGGASSGYTGTDRGGASNYGSGASQTSGSARSGGYATTDTTAGQTSGAAAGGTTTGYGGESTTSEQGHGAISRQRLQENESMTSGSHGAVSRERMRQNQAMGQESAGAIAAEGTIEQPAPGHGSAAGQFGASPTPGGADIQGAGETGASYASREYGGTGGREGTAANEEVAVTDPLGEPTPRARGDEPHLQEGSPAGPGVRPSKGDRDLQEEGDSHVDERGRQQRD